MIKQYNRPIKSASHYGTIHAFKLLDIGEKRLLVNRGTFVALGQDGGEISIGGELGEKMVDNLLTDFAEGKSFTVEKNDVIYLEIFYEEGDPCEVLNITSVGLFKDQAPTPQDLLGPSKIIEIGKVTDQYQIDGSEFWITEIEQIWKSDIVDIFLGSGDDNASSSCNFTEEVEISLITELRCDTATDEEEEEQNAECCIYITPTLTTIRFCGEVVESSYAGETIVCCCSSEPV